MSAPQKALLLVGSPKPDAGTSESLGGYLLEELEKRGVATETIRVTKAVRNDETVEELRSAAASADLIILSFPLYVDTLPAPAIRALEVLADPPVGPAAFVAICQSGFPEVDHNEVAIEICRNFARDAGFEWAGGLAMGAGGMVDGAPLRKVASRMRSAVRALDLAADTLAAGVRVPDEAVALMARPAFPAAAYRLVGNWGWRSQFKKQGRGGSLKDQPFA